MVCKTCPVAQFYFNSTRPAFETAVICFHNRFVFQDSQRRPWTKRHGPNRLPLQGKTQVYNPGQKWLGHSSCITYPPSPLINVGKYRVFSNKNGEKNHLIINIESGGRTELASCPNSFVWDILFPVTFCRHIGLLQLNQYVNFFS